MEKIATIIPVASTLTNLIGEGLNNLGKAMAANQKKPSVGAQIASAVPRKKEVSVQDLKIASPKDSKAEKVLDKANTVLAIVTCEGLAGGLLAPLSIAGGYWSLARAQNVKGREAHFKAMATDGAVDYLSLGNGKRLPGLSGYPSMVEAAKGQGCLGQHAPLNSAFHNSRERGVFTKQYNKTMGIIKKMYQTPEGRKELKELVVKYKAFKKSHSSVPAHTFFLQGK